MRRIIVQSEKDKTVKRNHLIMGLILIFLMVFSTMGFAFSTRIQDNSIEEVDYNNIRFTRNSGYWGFNVQEFDFLTLYNPQDLEDINFFIYQTINNYANKPLYFVGDINGGAELDRNLRDRFVLRISNACLEEGCEEDFPVKDCSEDNIIIFKETEDENEIIYQEENCIYITSSPFNRDRYADAVLFSLLGVR